MAGPDLAGLEAQYQLPPGILAATAHVESRGNPNAVSSAGAQGMFQLLPGTAKDLGVANSFDPSQAAEGAAKLWRQNLDKSGGDIDTAAMAYHAGWDRSGWKEKTHAYPGLLASALANGSTAPAHTAPTSAANPFDDAFTGGTNAAPKAAATTNSFDDAFSGATPAPHAGVPNTGGGQTSQGAGDNAGVGNSGVARLGVPVRAQGQNSGQVTPNGSLFTLGHGIADGYTAGWLDKIGAAGNALIPYLGQVDNAKSYSMWGGHSFGDAYGHNLHLLQDQADADSAAHPYANIAGNLAGGVLSPINKISAPVEGAGLLSNALRLGGQGQIFGASYGAGHSRSDTALGVAQDAASDSLWGGAGAAVLGSAAEMAIPSVTAAASPYMSKLAGILGKPSTTVQADPAVIEGLQSMLNNRVPRDQVESFIKAQGVDPKTVGGLEDAFASKGPIKVVPKVADITPAQAQDALGSRGSNTGIASNPGLTPDVQARTDALRQQGVPDDQALRQASIESIGANPMTAHVTRDPVLQQKTNEAAKLDTPEGAQINAQNATNNDALVKAMTGTVKSYGGAPAPGEAMQGSAEKLAAVNDAKTKIINNAYTEASKANPEARGPTDGLRTILTDPMNLAAATTDASAFVRGMATKLKILDPNGTGASPQALEQLRQSANEALTPTASGALKKLVKQAKTAIDGSFDELAGKGDAFKAARALHSERASVFDDQPGVADLIARDYQGNFINKDSFASKDSWLTNKNDAKALQVIRTLQDNGGTAELDKIRAHVTQGAYDKASSGAVDQLNNGTISGKAYRAHLDSVGQNKLDALFSPEEQSHLANLGNAASTLNEKVPNTFNGSNTDSAQANRLADALAAFKAGGSPPGKVSKAMDAAIQIGGPAVGYMTHGMAGGEAGAAIGYGADQIKKLAESIIRARSAAKASGDVAEAIKGAANPDVARASANDNAIRELAKTIAKERAGAVAGKSGAVVGQRRREGN